MKTAKDINKEAMVNSHWCGCLYFLHYYLLIGSFILSNGFQGMIVTTPHIDPWTHGSFAPLPEAVLQALRTVNAIEMPSRHAFDVALGRFVAGLSSELRETATFTIESYSEVARAVSEGTVAELPPKLRTWATCHHARAGSRKSYLILLPRDAFYNMNPADEEKLRANYIVQTDGEANGSSSERFPENGGNSLESAAVFERVPVQSQIYDILVFTHRNHGVASTMLFEARRIGIVRTLQSGYSYFLHHFSGYNYLAHGRDVHTPMSLMQDAR